MKAKLTLLGLLSAAFLLTISCISQVKSKDREPQNAQKNLDGEKLLNNAQLEMLSGINQIVLADYDENQRPKKNRELTKAEMEDLVKGLTSAIKDTSIQINTSRPYAHKLELKGTNNYFLTLLLYEDTNQLKIGDIRHGVIITGVDQGFLNYIKKIVESE